MFCSFIRGSDGLYQCEWCDWVYPLRIDKPPIRGCTNSPSIIEAAERLAEATGDLTIIEKAAHYAVALVRWKRAGYPVRTDEEVERIYHKHCEPCDLRRNNSCRLCGCRVVAEGAAISNKVKMATESCDDGKWGDG